jgi:hypothetical protein
MSEIKWNLIKNDRLKATRGVSFEDLLNKGKLIAVKKHPIRVNQSIMLFEYKKYIWIVPFVKDKNGIIFLKTLYPSRKYTKIYKGDKL